MRRLEHERLEKKAFKMALILMLRDLEPRERTRKIAELTRQEFEIPHSRKTALSRSVLYRWLKEFRKGDPDTVLLPRVRADRGVFRKLSTPQQQALIRWRYDNLYRTTEDLREELLQHSETSRDPVPAASTIARFLRSVGLDRRTLQQTRGPAKVRLAYEAPYPQYLWLADTKGPNLYVRDPVNPDRVVLAKLIVFIDDYSRFCPAFGYVLEENEAMVMLLFRRGVTAYGIPERLYVDLGGPYKGHSLKKAAALLGCRISHTGKGDAAAKGKVEKLLQNIYARLESELLSRDSVPTFNEANKYLTALIMVEYHDRVHATTGESPRERFLSFSPRYRRFVSEATLTLIFLPVINSHVTKTGLIRLHNRQYLVPELTLYRQWVQVRYDPLDRSRVYVWFQDLFYGEAHQYVSDTDYLKRQELVEKMTPPPEPILPAPEAVPPYGRLERILETYRLEVQRFENPNVELAQSKAQKELVRAALLKAVPAVEVANESPEFGAGGFAHLLSRLLKRSFDAHERLLLHTVWETYGPIEEALVRKTVGRLLGESHPSNDLSGFLDALRIAMESDSRPED